MSQIKIGTSLNIDLEFDIAPFHKRFFAWLIDLLIFTFYYIIVVKIVQNIKEADGTANNTWIFLILILPIALYPVVFEYTMQGQTIGKKLLHIKVINAEGGNATISQYLLRWLLRVADFIMIIMILLIATFQFQYVFMMLFTFILATTDVLCVILTNKSQRLGDMAANTILINTKSKHILNETVFVAVEDSHTVMYPQVMKFSDRDLNTIKTIHNNLKKKYDPVAAANIAFKVQSVLNISTTQDSMTFLETLLKDYNFLSTR